jgi:four helix bundle protein
MAVHKHVVPMLPPEEKWDLSKQIRTSSKSVMANIAEGYGRYYYTRETQNVYELKDLDPDHGLQSPPE